MVFRVPADSKMVLKNGMRNATTIRHKEKRVCRVLASVVRDLPVGVEEA